MPQLQMKQKPYRVARWMYVELDDIELLYEVSILSNCTKISRFKVCRYLLRWCVNILMSRWDETKYISFWDALKVVRDNKDIFSREIVTNYWHKNKLNVKRMVELYKDTNDSIFAFSEYKKLFSVSNSINIMLKSYLHSLVANTTDFLQYFVQFFCVWLLGKLRY